ncbi:MAG: hypothetical protein J6Q78_01055 [Clostridia bacterium]|nr:hypothetical protein [Clostridia bacterium]
MKLGYNRMKCGLIGEHLTHSFSKIIHAELADYSYELFELPPESVEDFVKNSDLDAFNVTIPYKKDVIPFIDVLSPEAKAIGSVNTIVRKDGKIYGYNTDYFGFSHMIDLSGIDVKGKKAIIFGTRGTAVTANAVLHDRGVSNIVMLGCRDNTHENRQKYSDFEIIVNATPVGMYPKNGASPICLSEFPNCICVYDVIYNPSLTSLLIEAEEKKIPYVNGLPMLVAQAAKAFEYFTEDTYEAGCIEKITDKISKDTLNIILVGMPGSGKTTVGSLISKMLGREFIDTDVEFEKSNGLSPAECINTMGEKKFRELECDIIRNVGKRSGIVIATGGGVVTQACNYAPLHQNGKIFFIERDLKNLSRDGRPLSMKISAEDMYLSRINSYRRFADFVIYSNENPDDTAKNIIFEFKKM